MTYNFNYDGLGRKTSVSVGTQTLSTNVYSNDRNGLLTEVQYGNGGKVKYTYDDFDRLTGVAYDAETSPRYTYTYDASGEVAKVKDNHLNRSLETERDLAFRPRQSTLKDGSGNTLYRTTLYYDKMNHLEKLAEQAGGTSYTTAYTYDKDNRTTGINYDGDSNKISYTYDSLGRVKTRTAAIGTNSYTTTYDFVAGNATLYGANATTPLVSSIVQTGMNFNYAYDSRGNIISETRNGLTTHYAYDALAQLIRVDDPHEKATWTYEYDCGGNITNKKQYKWPANATSAPNPLGNPTVSIPYIYGDTSWKDKLTSYNGKTITYDAIGNPLDDGERIYTWGAGRQLKHITMLLSGTDHGFRTTEGKHTDSNTILRIAESGSTLVAKVFRGTREITSECPASAFRWTRTSGNTSADTTWNDGHVDMKSIPFTDTDIANGVKYNCTYTETQGSYGTVSVNNALTASHTQSTADANHTFSLTNGMLKVNITNNAGNGTEYTLNGNALQVNNGFSGSITAMYEFTESNVRDVDFVYDHNGLRTRKTVTENGVSTVYDYTLHGKLITCMTKRVGDTVSDTLHFFYDKDSKPAFVKWNNVMYRYVHNLQGDIVGILDANGNLVVEYKYDAWGAPISITGTSKTTLGALNPFRYRGYVYDEESKLYYLQSRFYNSKLQRFINADILIGNTTGIITHNIFVYCINNSVVFGDPSGFVYEVHFGGGGGAYAAGGSSNTGGGGRTSPEVYSLWTIIKKKIAKKWERIKSIWKKTTNTVHSYIGSIGVDVGGGVGLYMEVNRNGSKISGGIKKDYVHIVYENGNIDIGRQMTQGFSLTINDSLVFDTSITFWHSFFDDECDCRIPFFTEPDCPAWKETITCDRALESSVGGYSFIGGEFSFRYYG